MISEKSCFCCKEIKDSIEFFKNKRSPDGLASSCKKCCKQRTKRKNVFVRVDIDILNEKWSYLPGYESFFEVSDQGRVRSCNRSFINRTGKQYNRKGVIRAPQIEKGYLKIVLSKHNIAASFYIHRLVAITHIPNPLNLPEVNHKKGVKTDNRASELEWCTASENAKHSYDQLSRSKPLKGKFGKNHHTSKKVNQFDLSGNFIKTWDALIEVQRAGIAFSGEIIKCCKGVTSQVKGFKWKYA